MLKSYSELEAENTWLKGCLRESRREKSQIARWAHTVVALFATSTLLLALTWAGVIAV